ncbi:hypothetical protein GCM10020219_070790 [Nonomuraea dietziae]
MLAQKQQSHPERPRRGVVGGVLRAGRVDERGEPIAVAGDHPLPLVVCDELVDFLEEHSRTVGCAFMGSNGEPNSESVQ